MRYARTRPTAAGGDAPRLYERWSAGAGGAVPAGCGRWVEHRCAVSGEELLLDAPVDCDSKESGAGSGWVLRAAPVDDGIQAFVRPGTPGDYPRGRIARHDTVALRRTGLYGEWYSGREGHGGWLAEPGAAGGGSDEQAVGVSRGGTGYAGAADAAG